MAAALPDEIVQFTAPMFFVEEDKVHALIDVMRIGRANDTCTVELFTTPGSARCPEKFKEKIEQLCFGPGEVLKHVQIVIIDDDHFDTTLEFEVGLRNPKNCILGQFLNVARVLIIDNDVFPANSVRKPIEDMLASSDKDTLELSEMTITLLVEFLKFTFLRVPHCAWRSCCYAVLDQLHNVHYLIKIYIKVHLVDVVLNTQPDDAIEKQLWFAANRNVEALLLAIFWAAPNVLLLLVDWLKASPLDTNRPCRVALQINLFRKYLNYTEDSKAIVPVQDLTVAMNGDIPMLVEDGYQFVFPILRACGKLLIIMYFMLTSDFRTMLPLIIYPVTMFMFIRARQTQHVRLENELMEAEADSEGCIVSAVEAFEPTRDYRMRHMVTKKFTMMLDESRKANNKVRNFKFWNEQFVPWITIICIAMYMAFGAQLVLLGVETMGGYLAMIEIYNELGDRFQGMYEDLARGVQAGAPLVQLTKMLNLPTDIVERMQRNHNRREYMTKQLAKTQQENPQMILCPPHLAVDHLSFFDTVPVIMEDIGVKYLKALSAVHAHVHPEQIIFLTGHHGCGKTTLLRILTDIVTPCGGVCLFSSHNRSLDVSNTPHLVPHCTLYENLTYGTRKPDPARCRRIFQTLGLANVLGLSQLLDEDIKNAELEATLLSGPESSTAGRGGDADSTNSEEKPLLGSRNGQVPDLPKRDQDSWHKQLSYNERKRIHMARGFMFNPEILAMHKPVDSLDARDIDNVLAALKSFVTNRGVEELPNTVIDRRPRTLFFTGGENHNNERSHTIADQVWFMHGEGEQFHGIQVFTRDEYEEFIREKRVSSGVSFRGSMQAPPAQQPEPRTQEALQPQDLQQQLEQSYAPFVQQIQETEKKFAAAQAENRSLQHDVARYKQESESREQMIVAMQAAERARAVVPISFNEGVPRRAPANWGTIQQVTANAEDMPRTVRSGRGHSKDGGFCSRSCT